jgi:hypothetical protein
MRTLLACTCFAIAYCLLSSVASGFGCNHWDMPSTSAQCFGYGYGPGHHAPMVRPSHHCRHHQQRAPRYVAAPRCGYACGGYNCCPTTSRGMGTQYMQPGMMRTPEMAPPAEPLPSPTAEPRQTRLTPFMFDVR